MKPSRCAVSCSLAALSMALGVAASGCSRPSPAKPPPAPPSTTPSPAFESMVPAGSAAQRRAQQTWCSYLDALYHRATKDGTSWEQLARCNAETSTAAPEMLERTAACSKQALDGFTGDPFSEGYAAEVKRCGTTIIDAMALSPAEVEPYVEVMCQRASACGAAEASECRTELAARIGKRLGRAVGALNTESRSALRQCLAAAPCQEVGEQLSGCLEPILDRLLWTPG